MILLLFISSVLAANVTHIPEDPHQWLEDVGGEKALDWVRGHNANSVEALSQDEAFKTLQSRLLSIMESDDRIPMVGHRDGFYTTSGKMPRIHADSGDAPRWNPIAPMNRNGNSSSI